MNETTLQGVKKLSEQRLHYNELINQNVNVTEQFVAYWKLYSSFNTWHFWFILIIIIALLVALFSLIDRQHVFCNRLLRIRDTYDFRLFRYHHDEKRPFGLSLSPHSVHS